MYSNLSIIYNRHGCFGRFISGHFPLKGIIYRACGLDRRIDGHIFWQLRSLNDTVRWIQCNSCNLIIWNSKQNRICKTRNRKYCPLMKEVVPIQSFRIANIFKLKEYIINLEKAFVTQKQFCPGKLTEVIN